ncbi:response regulator [Sulfuricurvum sp.]|uniref:response regulator n=1 Tax=Sulfuricurvum sp. TaxID=2025608 RepID=UPI002E2EDEA6|nr:response regulator [Sulfuricurvum sp.]HEX5330937.1 response regulator [Sulfuricurvum sp.]
MKYYLHSIINSLHQITSYAALLRKYPDKIDEYTHLIEHTAFSIDTNLQELFQTNHTPSDEYPKSLNTNVASGKRVLIVDDMSENREILSDIFQTLHCDVRSASGGLEALQIVGSFAPDMVCMDILMPGMDGYATAAELRKAGYEGTLIAISALKEDLSKSVFDAWLFKPFTAEQIISLLASQSISRGDITEVSLDFSPLSVAFRKELCSALEHGALSQSEKLVEMLEAGEIKTWLLERLDLMDFDAIINALSVDVD